MIVQWDAFDARRALACNLLGMSLWAELRGWRLRAFQHAADANFVWCAIHGVRS